VAHYDSAANGTGRDIADIADEVNGIECNAASSVTVTTFNSYGCADRRL
jgi:hypothetical protein